MEGAAGDIGLENKNLLLKMASFCKVWKVWLRAQHLILNSFTISALNFFHLEVLLTFFFEEILMLEFVFVRPAGQLKADYICVAKIECPQGIVSLWRKILNFLF